MTFMIQGSTCAFAAVHSEFHTVIRDAQLVSQHLLHGVRRDLHVSKTAIYIQISE